MLREQILMNFNKMTILFRLADVSRTRDGIMLSIHSKLKVIMFQFI